MIPSSSFPVVSVLPLESQWEVLFYRFVFAPSNEFLGALTTFSCFAVALPRGALSAEPQRSVASMAA